MATVADILNPLASLEWKECQQLPVGMRDATAVWHRNRLCLGGWTSGTHRDDARVYIYSPTTDTWDTPIDTPVYWFGLTTYLSKLVLVGGKQYVSEAVEDTELTNKLWVLNQLDQWQESLPPMSTKRHSVCTVNYNDHLLVAGGMLEGSASNIVEIFNGSHWLFAQPLPMSYYDLKSVTLQFGQYWLFMGGKPPLEYSEQNEHSAVYYVSLDSLLASCHSSETSQPSSVVWKRLTDAPYQYSSPVVFGDRLIAVGGDPLTPAVHAYCFHTSSWIHIGDMPFATCSTCSTVLPTGELMVLGGYDLASSLSNALKAKIKVIYNPDDQFTVSALSRLEDVGIPVMSPLNTKIQILHGVLCLFVPNVTVFAKFNDTKALFDAWLHFSSLSHFSPSWKNLLLIIRLLSLDELAQRMETYISAGATDLEEQHSDSESESGTSNESEDDVRLRDEVIYKLKQEMSILKEEKDLAIFMLEEKITTLTAENKQLRCQELKNVIDLTAEEKPLASHESKERTIKSLPECSAIWNLRGVEVCGEMTAVVYSSHYQQIIWPGYGLRLNIPKGCLPAGMEQCTINVKVSLAGQYEFPVNSHPVSAIIWLRCEDVRKFEFTRPVTVEIQHCAKSENVTNLKLSFVRAVCSQKQLPYTFKQLAGGNFTSHSSYGVIELNSFSGVGIIQEGSEDREYRSRLFYLNQDTICHEIHFVVTWNTQAHLTVVEEEYMKKKALSGPDQNVEFESDMISLDIPMEGLSIKGWKITPLIRPVVTKKQVDNFKPGKGTPRCQLKVVLSGRRKKKLSAVQHQVTLQGAKFPHNVFTITLPTEDANAQNFQTFGDLAATGTSPPPAKRRRSESDESAFLANSIVTRSLSVDSASVAGPSSASVMHVQPKSGAATGLNTKPVKPELKDLIKELLAKASDKWENTGILLGIEPGRLDAIKASENLSQNCLREMLKIWLNRVSPPPSWAAIADAVELLGDQKLADHLRTKYQVPP